MEILKTQDLKKYYGTEPNIVRAIDGINFSVEEGEFVAVVGTSGSGKSTLLHMVGGLDIPTSGTVFVRNRNLSELNDNAWIIDPGDIDKIVEILPKKCSVKGVFITHYHFDHIYGLNSLTYLFPGLVVFATEIIATGLYSDKMNLSYYHNQSFVYQGKNLIFLSDNEVVDLDNGNKIVAIDTSGHNESCLSFMLNNYLFTGDSYIPNVKLVTNLPRSNKEKAKKSLERILGLIKDDTIVCPGHGAIIKNGY